MKELDFQNLMVELINSKLDNKKFIARKGKAILYELKVDEELNIIGNPKDPKRGSGAFETDVTIFSKKENLEIPFIVLEVKDGLSSDAVITYSNKASRHKIVYPFLRYGLVSYGLSAIPKRFFKHNQNIDFFLAVQDYCNDKNKLAKILYELVENELRIFENLQKILHSKDKMDFYQNIPILENLDE